MKRWLGIAVLLGALATLFFSPDPKVVNNAVTAAFSSQKTISVQINGKVEGFAQGKEAFAQALIEMDALANAHGIPASAMKQKYFNVNVQTSSNSSGETKITGYWLSGNVMYVADNAPADEFAQALQEKNYRVTVQPVSLTQCRWWERME